MTFDIQTLARNAVEKVSNEVLFAPDDPVRWIEREFWIPETGTAIVLEDYQKRVVREALSRDASGLLHYSLVLYSDLKKSAKSTIAAAVCLFLAWHNGWESVRVVANDLKQANSRTFYYIERAIMLNPRLKAACGVKQYHITLPNSTVIEAIPVDPKGEAGGGDLIVCFTELWAAKSEAAKQLWSETTLSPLKYGKSLRWCESYAGYEGESPILEQLYEVGVKQGETVDVGLDGLELYKNEAARLLCLWNTVPRCSWQTAGYYAQEAAVLVPSEFSRIHRNQWQSATLAFIPAEWWDACYVEVYPNWDKHTPVVLAMDAAVTNDCFAVVGVSRVEGQTFVRFVRVWTPTRTSKVDFSEPEAYIRQMCREYPVVEVAYDSYQLVDMAQRLQREGVGWFRVFQQGAERARADKQLYDNIMERRLHHNGDQPELRQHIINADRKQETEQYLRIVKREATGKPIDACVALSMANAEARRLNIG